MNNIAYRDDVKISVEEAIDLYKRSTLGARRPIDRPDIFKGMLDNSNLIAASTQVRYIRELTS